MARKFIDCREFPGDRKCTVAIVADNDEELMRAAMLHAIDFHGQKDTPEFRRLLAQGIRDGMPSEKPPAPQWMLAMAMKPDVAAE